MKLRKRAPFVAAISLLAIVHAAGWMSLGKIVPSKDSFTASVIQGNVSSDITWDMISGEETTKIFRDHMDLTRKMTFYTKHGDVLAWASLTLSIIFFIMRIFKKTREKEHHGPKRAVH
jgi:apolipoprotein N-acyltransferase